MPHDPTGRKPSPSAGLPNRLPGDPGQLSEKQEKHFLRRGVGDSSLLRVSLELGVGLEDYVAALFENCPWLRAGDDGEDLRNRLFKFVRWARAHPRLTALRARDAWNAVSRIVARYPGTPDDWWGPAFGLTARDAQGEFLHWWGLVYSLPTLGPLEYALLLADSRLLSLPPDGAGRRHDDYPRFVTLAVRLQKNAGRRSVFFQCERIAPLLGVGPRQVYRFCEYLVDDGFAELTARGSPGRRARYRIDLSRFPELGQE